MFGAGTLTDEGVRAAAEGSRLELERVLEALGPQVWLMLAARLSHRAAQSDTVDDLAQQVMTAVAAGICRLADRTIGGLKAFVSGIVVHKVSDWLKRRGEWGDVGPVAKSLDSTVADLSGAGPLWQFLSGGDTSPRSAVDRAEQTARLMYELGELNHQQREIITLVVFDQCPVREAARQIGVSRAAASMRLVRAIETLRRNMTGSSKFGQGHDTAK